MSSAYQALYPPRPDTTSPHQDQQQPRNLPSHSSHTAGQDPQFLNPFNPLHPLNHPFSPQLGVNSNSASPAANTPADSESTLSIHYPSSEFSEGGDDPFPGVNFNLIDAGSPSFLDDHILLPLNGHLLADNFGAQAEPVHTTQNARRVASHLPLSPDKSPSLVGASPNGQTWGETGVAQGAAFSGLTRTSVSPHELSLAYHGSSPAAPLGKLTTSQPTPGTSDATDSSDDGIPAFATMQSPRVTVSHWDADNAAGALALKAENAQELEGPAFAPARDSTGRWIADQATGQAGLDPSARSATHVDASANDLAADRALDERNREVDDWLERHSDAGRPDQLSQAPNDGDDNISKREISLGDQTENKPVPGQTYYTETGGELTSQDLELMRQGRNWEDAPIPLSIYKPDPELYHADSHPGYQPQTSHAAMARYQQMCRDTDSIVSRAATWGTRRFSMPSFDHDGSFADPDVQVAGNLFKKMSLNRGDGRRPSILQGLRSLVRKTSINAGKRKGADADDAKSFMTVSSAERKEIQAQAKLAPPPSPKPSWTKKGVPSINTALVGAGSQAALVGATAHARHGSVSAASIASPLKSPSARNLSVKGRNRLRSKSENLTLAELWKRDGGPPVANLGNTKVNVPEAAPADEDDEDEDDLHDDLEVKSEPTKEVGDITPTFAGFQQHVLKLNPSLNTNNNYLVDRIAHQQVVRYKALLGFRVKHLQATASRNCSSGSMCIALGGSANLLVPKGEQRGVDPLSARYDGSDGDVTPLEGAINPESFPQDIPMPPTGSMPAEFECQLCFAAKKFEKPSDWTKHVHEDVQPFTCTWERCKDPKMFKRKADWVRHENEGHRHLEWWTCDVDDCRHKCFRRDNFLHHLVREHKFPEPLHKTKAAIKRAGGIDPTWKKVDDCHQDTHVQPESEPCRFCGKSFQSWKKLTVHLAKHMEHISLPVLGLVAKKELDEDTVISPVQDPPPRTFQASFPVGPDQQLPYGGGTSPALQHGPMGYHSLPQHRGMFPLGSLPRQDFSGGFFNPGFAQAPTLAGMAPPPAAAAHPHHPHAFQGLSPQLPVTSAPFMLSQAPPQTVAYMAVAPPPAVPQADLSPEIEPFPTLDLHVMGLGLQDPGPFGGAGVGGGDAGMHPLQGQLQGQLQHPQQHPQQRQQQQQFVPQGSVSPYGHSPSMPQQGFY
ncbi:hypothetical protein C8A05DRAFT_17605 [Staphylotrichum tortipilum]|uniref:C2H2-type domain-containing protein n=1 Tax=Staphylotrichum tortipilum TaxID=2831512 RepID=A0AAN6RRQ1_9PEZI|nr:hypothetical protein C8A05DRAFT_17605 [Staphylotrichum longicolle]